MSYPRIYMSDNSNEPNPIITIEELFEPTISINKTTGYAHFFFGKTPRAQISIKFVGVENYRFYIGLLKSKFPNSKMQSQPK